MKKKVALFIDWENFRRDIECAQKSYTLNVNYNIDSDINDLIKVFLEDDEEIYRIYFYTTPPFNLEAELQKKINSEHSYRNSDSNEVRNFTPSIIKSIMESEEGKKSVKIFENTSIFQHKVSSMSYVEIRYGKCRLNSVQVTSRDNYKIMLEQKQVDMLMGIDISTTVFKKVADRILVFSKDTDLVPALKLARNEGARVDIANLRNGNPFPDELRFNSDKVREFYNKQINDTIASFRSSNEDTSGFSLRDREKRF